MKVASFSKANNVVFSGFVVFLSLLLTRKEERKKNEKNGTFATAYFCV